MRKIYMRAEAFGESIDMKYRRDEVADIPLEPREFAAQYINPVRSTAPSHICLLHHAVFHDL